MDEIKQYGNQSLYSHILFEFKHGVPNGDYLLTESHGYFDDVDIIAQTIIKAMSPTIKKAILYGEKKEIDRTFTREDFSFDVFFDNLTLHLTFIPSETTDYYGGFNFRNTKVTHLEDGTLSYHPYISLTCQAKILPDAVHTLYFALGHELTHAHSELEAAKGNGGWLQKSEKYAKSILFKELSGVDRHVRVISHAMYVLDRRERNAFIAQLKQELETHKDEILDSKSATETITKTESYKDSYLFLTQVAHWLINTKFSDEEQDDICQVMSKITNKAFNTLSDVIKYIVLHAKKWQKEYEIRASKIAYDIFAEDGLAMLF